MKSTTTTIIALLLATNNGYVASAKESSLRGGLRLSSQERVRNENHNDDATTITTTTSSCTVGVQFSECPIPEPLELNNDCIDPFQTMTFRYTGGDCSQSDNLLDRHDFTCVDLMTMNNEFLPTYTSSTGSSQNSRYITVTSRSGSETYFAGNVSVGQEYTLNSDNQYPVLAGEMTITVYDSPGGIVLQRTELLMDCTHPLFLFDRFGSSQVTAWKEISGREVHSIPDTKRTGRVAVTINNPVDDGNNTPIRLVEMVLLSNLLDEPVNYTSQVQTVTLQPSEATLSLDEFEFEYDLLSRTRYTFFTTIIAESLDGTTQCNSAAHLECIL